MSLYIYINIYIYNHELKAYINQTHTYVINAIFIKLNVN